MSAPISARIISAARRLDAGDRAATAQLRSRGARAAPRSRPRAGRSVRRGSRCARGSRRSSSAWCESKRPCERLAQRAGACCAACPSRVRRAPPGRVVPEISASSIAAPGLAEDVRGDAVELDPGVLQRLVQPVGFARRAPGSGPCGSGSGSAAARIGLGGTKLARNSPASISWHSHSASSTSVLRPGTTRSTDCMSCAHRCPGR